MGTPASAPKSQQENRTGLSSKTLLIPVNIYLKNDVELKTSFRMVSTQCGSE